MSTIINKSDIAYHYQIDPSGSSLNKNIESNVVTTNLILPNLKMTKTVDKFYATIGDTLNYTIVLSNTGNILLSDINLKDILPSGATFVPGSVKVANVSQPSYDIVLGFNLGSLIILGSITVTFQATVSSLPSPNTIINKALATFNYLVTSIISGNATSNSVTTNVNVTNVTALKTANVTDVEVNDEIIYTVVLTNSGTIDATNIMFTDVLDSQLSFVTGSVTVNGTIEPTYDPNTGFNIPNIVPNTNATIIFKAIVNE